MATTLDICGGLGSREDEWVDVYIDSAPESMIPELALRAERVLEDRWNGWLRPLATASAFGAFLDAWRANDPNGIWGYVSAVGDTLVCSVTDSDDPADEFPRAGQTANGTPLYDVTGWAWTFGT
jgi:hypothetical protein